MKIKVISFAIALCFGVTFFTACDDDDDKWFKPDKLIVEAFEAKYPNINQVVWENEKGLTKAEFKNGAYESEAWFDPQGNWMLTESDIPYGALPKEVKDGFKASAYADWKVDDVDMLERPGVGITYVIDVEQGEKEMELYFTENGVLIKEMTDDGNDHHFPNVIPDAISESVLKLYPGAKIYEIDADAHGFEVDILHNNIHKEVYYDTKQQWLYTEWEIQDTEVPAIVMEALMKSEYATYHIDDIHLIEKSDALFYEFELEQGAKELVVIFDQAGVVVPKA